MEVSAKREARETLVMRVEVLEKHLAQQHERADDLTEQVAKQGELIRLLQREVGLG